MEFKKGEIVLVKFPFTDLSGSKLRPALILYDSGSDVIVAFISSVIREKGENEVKVLKSEINGLKVDSIIRVDKIATLSKGLIAGKIGELESEYINKVDELLKNMFGL